ncbi:MAG TPA: type II secretion system protein GspL [Sideroxyarcus sp.]|nr:type II secretion system protein GspL [Sideroxyarcus sp.]
MSELRIYVSAQWRDAASACPWVLRDAAGAVLESGTTNLAGMPRADECIAVIAADRVLCAPVRLPKIKRSQLETALPYALEDLLLGDAADCHVVPGALQPDGATVLYAIDRHWLTLLANACETAKIRLRKVVPEFSLVPVQPGEWSVAWDGKQGFVATGQGAGGALGCGDMHHFPAALLLRLQTAPLPPTVLRLYARAGLPQWHTLPAALIGAERAWDWASAPVAAETPNLLWGKFAPPAKLEEWWPKLRPAFLLLLVLFVVEALGNNVQWWLLASEKRQLERTMDGLFKETFGAEAVIVDAPLQMRRNLARLRHAAGLRDEADFVPLLEMLSTELAAFPGGKVKTLRYTEGQLDVEAFLPGVGALAGLQRRMAGLGMNMQTLDSRETNGGMDVHLKLIPGEAR